MATKTQIVKALMDLKIEHDEKAKKEDLLALLPAELQASFADGQPATPTVADSYALVQLTRNAAGHQVGETFSRAGAKRLGILDHCRPFSPGE